MLKYPALGSPNSAGTPLRCFAMKWPIVRSVLSSSKIPFTQLFEMSSLRSQATLSKCMRGFIFGVLEAREKRMVRGWFYLTKRLV